MPIIFDFNFSFGELLVICYTNYKLNHTMNNHPNEQHHIACISAPFLSFLVDYFFGIASFP